MPRSIRCLLGLLLCSATWQSVALAQDTSPRQLVEQGYFEQALASVEANMESGPLRPDLIDLLEVRALVQLALGDTDAVRATLRQLVALAPEYAPPPTASPDFGAEVGRAKQLTRGALSAELRAPSSAGSPWHAELIHDPGGLGLRAAIRSRAGGVWIQRARAWRPDEATTQMQAVVLGAQGQVLLEGSIEPVAGQAPDVALSPEQITLDDIGAPNPPSSEATSPRRRRVLLGVIIGVLAAAGVVTALVLSQRGDTRYVPVLDW